MAKFGLFSCLFFFILTFYSAASKILSNGLDDPGQNVSGNFSNSPNQVCPGGSETCPDIFTCCMVDQGAYSCCPLPNAVCCSDKLHCCPESTTCDLPHLKCIRGSNLRGYEMVPYEKLAKQILNDDVVVCPGGEYQCPDDNTCCMLESGDWGCCPLPDAVCCDDKIHCCPSGNTCGEGRCESSTTSTPKAKKTPATPVPRRRIGNVVCPGGEYQCPDDNTCCMLESGDWGCCPMPDAVCCDDKVHCCPSGTTCEGGLCDKGRFTIPWSTKVHATPVPKF